MEIMRGDKLEFPAASTEGSLPLGQKYIDKLFSKDYSPFTYHISTHGTHRKSKNLFRLG